MSEAVLDASALLAVLEDEPGADKVLEVLYDATMSAVNLSEVVAKLRQERHDEHAIRSALGRLALTVAPFDEDQAYRAGLLRSATNSLGLSLGDRACLALAKSLDLPAYTADRSWGTLRAGVKVVVIR
ncbi:MAG: type II toxin-antitoxin system VapC family toxin [Chloroflexi bacterium]|nr:type II toxin-antitoxin system VapC family toxin [Chloroflexota bacterium]